MQNCFIVLLPPIIVLLCAGITRNVVASLLIGIFSAAFIATDFSLIKSITHSLTTIKSQIVNIDNLYLFAFLILLGTIIEMMTYAGGITAYTKKLKTFIKNKKSAETTTLGLLSLFVLDDYLNGLTVGAVMRPLFDSMKIPRVKLAYFINAISAPIAIVLPITTWAAMILGQLQNAGVSDELLSNTVVNADPLNTYLTTIPFLFYPLLSIIAAWFIARKSISFGSMKKQEKIAITTGNLFGGKQSLKKHDDANLKTGSIAGFFIPIGTFVSSMIFLLFFSGNATFLGGTNSFMDALKSADSFWSLFVASAFTCIVSGALFLYQKQLSLSDIKTNAVNGFMMMYQALLVLLFAYTLNAILTNDLQSGAYLADMISGTIPLFALPLVLFLVSTAISASTGSSWGTIAIMLPLSISMLVALAHAPVPLLAANIINFFPGIGAMLAGSVAGAHFSPIHDSVIMSSTSSGCYHMDHLQTQISYSTPVFIGTCIAFTITGLPIFSFWINWILAFIVGVSCTIGLLLFRNKN